MSICGEQCHKFPNSSALFNTQSNLLKRHMQMGPTRDLMLFMTSKFRTLYNHGSKQAARLRLMEDELFKQRTTMRTVTTM